MTQQTVKKELIIIWWEVVGSILIAISLYNFAAFAKFPMTGISGLAMILYRLYQIPLGLSTILLNLPVAFMCYRALGKKFFFRSMRCMFISAVFIDHVAPLFPTYEGSRLLAAICAGVIGGLGFALIYMQNSSTGGTDFIIMAIKSYKPYISLGNIAFYSDIGIILLGGFIFKDVDGVIYGMIINYLFATMVDKVMYGINAGKMALIVTDDGVSLTKVIDTCTQRGSTIIKAEGGYKQEGKHVVMCACNSKEMYFLQKAIKETTPNAFMIVIESNEVHGEGFSVLSIGEKDA